MLADIPSPTRVHEEMEVVKATSDDDGILDRCAVEVTTTTCYTTCVHLEDELHAQTKTTATSDITDHPVKDETAETLSTTTGPAAPLAHVHPYAGSIAGKSRAGKEYADGDIIDGISAKPSDEQPDNEHAGRQCMAPRSAELSSVESPDRSSRESATSNGSASCVEYCDSVQHDDGKIDEVPSLTDRELDRFQVKSKALPKVNIETEKDSQRKHTSATAVEIGYLAHHGGLSYRTGNTMTKTQCTSSIEFEKKSPQTADSTVGDDSLPSFQEADIKKCLDLDPICSNNTHVGVGSRKGLDNRGRFNEDDGSTGIKDPHSAHPACRAGHDDSIATTSLSLGEARKPPCEYIQNPRLGCDRKSGSLILDKFDHNENEKADIMEYFGYYFVAHETTLYGAPIQLSAGSHGVWNSLCYWPQTDMYESHDHTELVSNSKPSSVKSSPYKKKKKKAIQTNDWNGLDTRGQSTSLSHLDVHTRDYLQKLEFFHQLGHFQAQNREQYIQFQEHLQQKARNRSKDGQSEQISQLKARSQAESSSDIDPHADQQGRQETSSTESEILPKQKGARLHGYSSSSSVAQVFNSEEQH